MAFDFEDDNYENIFSEAITINKYTSQGFEFSSDHKTLLMAPKDIIEFEVPKCVVSIGPSAFKKCKMLERIILHDFIRSIAKDAFEYCSALKTFELPNSIECINLSFRNCTSLSSIRIPDSIKIVRALNLPIKSLPKGLKVHGSIDASSTQLSSLPEGLKLGGYLNVSNTPITQLPNKMKIKYDIILRNTPITSLPDDLTKIGGDLMLGYSSIKSLPDGLKVNGSLELSNTPIASLPTGLKVGGNLILVNTPLTSLPDKLQVGEYLDLSFTSIQSLPDDLKVQIGIIDIDFEESKKEAINCFVENANSNNEEVNDLNYEEEEYEFDSWEEEEDFIIRLNKLEEDITLSFQVCDYHSADKWAIFDSASISLKDNKALLNLEGSIKLEMWNGPENIQHLFKYLSEAVIESGLFIHSEDDDLELDNWCTITLGVLIDKDFMFFETVNHYMKLIGDLETKAKQKWFENKKV